MNWYKKITEKIIMSDSISFIQKGLSKFAYSTKSHDVDFSDNDSSDGYTAKLTMTENKNNIIINVKFIGNIYSFPLFEETWVYNKEEGVRASRVYNRIVNVVEDLKVDFEDDSVPGPVLQGKAREELRYIDIDKKKKTNNVSLEAAKGIPGEGDWRNSLYSGKYPVININNSGIVNFNGKQE